MYIKRSVRQHNHSAMMIRRNSDESVIDFCENLRGLQLLLLLLVEIT